MEEERQEGEETPLDRPELPPESEAFCDRFNQDLQRQVREFSWQYKAIAGKKK